MPTSPEPVRTTHRESESTNSTFTVELQHGQRESYTFGGCRCRPCKDAQAAYMRDYNARKRAERKAAETSSAPTAA